MMELVDRLRSGFATSSDLMEVERIFSRNEIEFTERAISSYIRGVRSPNIQLLMKMLVSHPSAYVRSEIIKGLSYQGWVSDDFRRIVLEYAEGIPGDDRDYVRLASLSALPGLAPAELARQKLKLALNADNEVVRDVAVEAAQVYCGVSRDDLHWGRGDGELLWSVDPKVRRWLDAEMLH
ncbi:HEAT repeat domain-containing protein [Caulobacter segnis]|uniref:HEAT repeat domain-containing protein n=1 Tax=Caulobacter segnis TaxID=88688 RepID=UPI00285EF98D|nr:HEAT repeat domain-containing protein [Caulobacter segnis]MDR6624345.1 hypothetical protein [Caulobacter segnis]